MARALGTLTLDLVAKIGGFTRGMTEAERVADQKSRAIAKKQRQRAAEVEKAWSGISKAISGAFAGFSIAATIQKVVTETRNAQNEQAQLAAVLRSTGNAAGYTQKQLNDMAGALEGRSIFSAGDINQAQTRLLSYSGIVGEEFPRALQAAIDMASRMGMEVTNAAETVGRALDSPKDGLTALQKQGFRFTEDQKALVTRLQETGKSAEAQSIVLQALESSYGGAAAAARDTFGGAIAGLQNQLNSLLTGEDGSFDQATAAINEFTRTLSSEETKQAFATFTGWIADLLRTVVQAAAVISGSSFFGWLQISGKDAADADASIDRLQSQLDKLRKTRDDLDPDKSFTNRLNDIIFGDVGDLNRQIAATESKIKALEALRRAQGKAPAINDPAAYAELDSRPPRAAAPNAAGAAAAAAARKKAAKEAEQLLKQQQAAAEQYLKSLNDQLIKTQNLTVYERLMLDLKQGTVRLSGEQLQKAEGLATAIDMAKEAEESRQANLNLQNAQLSAQRDLMLQIAGYQQTLSAYGTSDRAAGDMQARLQILQTYSQRIRDLEDQQRQALALNTDESRTEEIRKQYEDQIAIQQVYQQRSLEEYEKFIVARNEKESSWQLGAMAGLQNYLAEAQNVYGQMQSVVTNAFGTMEDTVYDFITTGQLDLGNLFRSIAQDVVRMLIKIGIQMLVNAVLGKTIQAALAGSSFATGMAMAQAYAPAAAMASLASFGGNSIPALAGMVRPTTLSQTMALAGFAEGGFTGPGGKLDVAGLVHAGEYVVNAEATRKLGLGFLESLNGYADGGYVAPLPPAATRAAPDRPPAQPIVNIIEDASRARQVEMTTNERGEEIINVFVANIGSGGRAAKALEMAYGVTRRGR